MKKQIKQWGVILTLCILSQQSQSAQKSGFKIYGDIMQILPFAMMAYSYSIEKYFNYLIILCLMPS
ncbi:hypothetical protein [Helicobacter hepaticus]|uniref:hypothetical protein n=1 Tax=Helicobacter hepaticus TaxID=32025 RepID=UPI0002E362C7|nr:hypothetical protein [Helicobacter hepaticus]